MGKFGDKFRKERERLGVKLEDVSNSTKISSRMLRAIEEEHFDQLPGGVFNKGFIRAYAKHLGLDDEEAVEAYLETLNQLSGQHTGPENRATPPAATERRTDHSGERWHAGNDRRNNDRRNNDRRTAAPDSPADELPDLQLPKAEHVRPKRRMGIRSDSGAPWGLFALIALTIAAGALWWTHVRNARANGDPVPAAPAASSTTALPAPSQPADRDRVARTATASVSPLVKTGSHPVSPLSSQSSPSNGSANNSATSAGAREGATESETTADPSAVTAAPQPRAKLTLVIHASENSWISVSADGQSVVQETLIAPAHTSVRAAREIVVRAGNAAGVSFALNGQEIPSQGAEGEVKTLVFDSTGLRPTAPPPVPGTTVPPADPAR